MNPPPQSARRRSPLRIVVIVLCVIVALMVLAVGGIAAYAKFRPVSSADYSKAGNDAALLTEELTPIVTRQTQMMDLSLLPTPEQIEKAGQAQRDQVQTLRAAVVDLGELHGMGDPALKALQQQLLTAIDTDLSPMVDDFVGNYAAVLRMQQICTEYDRNAPSRPVDGADQSWFDSRIDQCEKAAKEAAKSTVFKPFVDVRLAHIADSRAGYKAYGEATTDEARRAAQSAIATAQNGIGTRSSDGLRAVSQANDAVFEAIAAKIQAIVDYCRAHE